MWDTIAQAADTFGSAYANSPVLRTAVGFAHIAGLVAGGGAAIVADRGVLAARPRDLDDWRNRASSVHGTHRVVLAGLACVLVSGVLLLAADYETYLRSTLFWWKMALVGLLLVNGAVLGQAGRALERGRLTAWGRLRVSAVCSLVLWSIVTLLGAALPNV